MIKSNNNFAVVTDGKEVKQIGKSGIYMPTVKQKNNSSQIKWLPDVYKKHES